jgi:UDP-N-acetylmuramoyl-L-alanyl-D-glutamate--2,6-diaminopimelate ligase
VQELLDKLSLDDIKIVGITGTNGKTTTAAAIYSILLDFDEKVAFQGTRGVYINDERVEDKSLTTPSIFNTINNLIRAKNAGCKYFIMEVSSHAIDQDRIESLKFALKVFTNLTQDHLDYHKTFEEYAKVKGKFFLDESLKLINKDSKKINFNTKNCYTYALDAPASFNILAYSLKSGITALIKHFDKEESFTSPMLGFFNVYNLLAAIASVKLITKYPLKQICENVEEFAGVSGRMEIVNYDPLVIVDFAHTPDGMDKVLDSMKDKEISVVFGAGGDRDRRKRVMMGRVANRYAKKIYLTNDNPRNEDPKLIIDDIYQGISEREKVKIILDREEAIKSALKELDKNEILFILGKGDESYQEIGVEKIPFDDRVVSIAQIKDIFNK